MFLIKTTECDRLQAVLPTLRQGEMLHVLDGRKPSRFGRSVTVRHPKSALISMGEDEFKDF